jgi:microcystin-dependent protein
MSAPFVAEIRIFAGNFAPRGWALCDGQLLPLSQNTALFSLVGTFYGGDGKSTFALPNLQGSAPIGQGQGPGLSDRFIGETGGTTSVTLLQSEMPMHTHQVRAVATPGNRQGPTGNNFGRAVGALPYTPLSTGQITQMSPLMAPVAGSSLPHNNMPPYLCVLFMIALQGVFPARP